MQQLSGSVAQDINHRSDTVPSHLRLFRPNRRQIVCTICELLLSQGCVCDQDRPTSFRLFVVLARLGLASSTLVCCLLCVDRLNRWLQRSVRALLTVQLKIFD